MTDRLDCLICGRLWLPSGEPSCDCLTHSLSRPVGPPQHEPDPADVALFPLEEERPRTAAGARRRVGGVERLGAAPVDAPAGAARPAPSHRKPRSRNRASLAAGGAVAAVVGSAALAASFFHGAVRDRAVSDALPPVPSLVLPDGNGESGEGAAGEGDGHTPAPEEGAETAPEGSEGAEPPPEEPEPDATGEAPQPDPTPTERPDPPPTGPGPEPTPTPPTAPVPDEPEEPDDPEDPDDPDDPDPGDPEPDPSGSLKEGDEGPEVVELQERMLELRWVYRGTAHGSYDAPTREAVARLQSAYAVTDDPKGVYGPHTRELLESLTTGR